MAKTTKKKSKGNTSKKIIFPDYINKLTEMLALYETKVPTDNPLSEQDKNNIMETCIDLYNVTGNYQQIYHDCHRIINTTLSSYNYQPRTPGATPPPIQMPCSIYLMS